MCRQLVGRWEIREKLDAWKLAWPACLGDRFVGERINGTAKDTAECESVPMVLTGEPASRLVISRDLAAASFEEEKVLGRLRQCYIRHPLTRRALCLASSHSQGFSSFSAVWHPWEGLRLHSRPNQRRL